MASDAVRALFTSMNSCTVMGPSERSDDSELCGTNWPVREGGGEGVVIHRPGEDSAGTPALVLRSVLLSPQVASGTGSSSEATLS